MATSGKLEWLERHQRVAAFAVAFALFMMLHYVENVSEFRWDAGTYWRLSNLHSLRHFPVVIRGYFLPVLLVPSRYMFDIGWGYSAFHLLSSAAYAYMLAVVLPGWYQVVFGGRVTFWRRLIVPLLTAAIFPGLIVYPLSDLPAVCIMLGAIVCAMHSVTQGDKSLARYGLLLLCGILIYGAYDTRTIFLFPALFVLLAVPLVVYRRHDGKARLIALSVVIVGVAIASIPQMLINVKHHGKWSPVVMTTAEDKSLFARQLLWGLTIQRYETSIDKSVPGPEVYYPDAAGQKLYNTLGIDEDSFTVADYLRLLVVHPMDFAGIYGRHFMNGLDVRDGEVYVGVQSVTRDGFASFNFLVVFLGFSVILVSAFKNPPVDEQSSIRWFWAAVALTPVLLIIPGAIETRFFLALHLAFYSAIAFGTDVSRITVTLRRHWLIVLLAFGMSGGIFFSLTLDAMADVEHRHDRVHVPAPTDMPDDSASSD